jgi:hypothetical protein
MHQRSTAGYVGVASSEMDRTSVGKPQQADASRAFNNYCLECLQPIVGLSILLGLLYTALFADVVVKVVVFVIAMIGISGMNRYMGVQDVLAARRITTRNNTGTGSV